MYSDKEMFIFILVLILLVVLRLATINSKKSKGKIGEYYTDKKLKSISKKDYPGHVLRNLYIPISGNRTSEIDLLYINEKGVFVIESKNYSGYIFGMHEYKNWTQTIYNQGTNKVEKFHFYNPIWQNNNHIKFLKEFLKSPNLPVYSIIVFSDKCELKDIRYSSSNTYVIQRQDLKETISSICNRSESSLNSNTVDKIYNNLLPLTQVTTDIKKIHVEKIHDKLSANDNKCPICGGNLVLRTAKRGPYTGNQFYGCSNYPKCHYTKQLDSHN